MMELRQLLKGVDIIEHTADQIGDVSSVCYAADQCKSGSLFVAIQGLVHDGHDFIRQALDNGARFIVHQKDIHVPDGVMAIRVPDSRRALGQLAKNYFGDPSSRLTLIGITGTSGKTTVAYLLESILTAAGFSCGVLGTVNYRYNGKTIPAPNTTPESFEMQKILSEMQSSGVTHVIAEISSHALDLRRVDDCAFDLGIFTNLSPEHLDYHHDMEDYFRAKKRFFTEILPQSKKSSPRKMVINRDDPWGRRLFGEIGMSALSYGLEKGNETTVDSEEITLEGIKALISLSGRKIAVTSRLIGRFNLSNILAAAAAASALGVAPSATEAGINHMSLVPGRLERIDSTAGVHVFVDYAHKPDALKQVLQNLDKLKQKRILTVFGCGGNRDRAKRPLMGETASRYSNLTILTSDNPRKEEPLAIIGEIEAGIDRQKTVKVSPDHPELPQGMNAYMVIADRKSAITAAVNLAEAGDIVLIAGKGHEDYQIFGTKKIPFDDRIVAKQALLSREDDPSEAASPVFSLEEVLASTGGRLISGQGGKTICGISTDSRNIEQGNLFIALQGENFDGHAFVQKAVDAGAAGVIVHDISRINPEAAGRSACVVEVKDTLKALGDLAQAYRRRFSFPVVGLTGSSGKTTTKEMLSCILRLERKVLTTEGNFNNLIGLPHTIFRMTGRHEIAVLEMGTNTRGEIRRLTQIAEPDVGVITNVGPAHLEGFGTVDVVGEEKGDLFFNMRPSGTAVVNLDDEAVCRVADRWSGRRVTFSMSASADVSVGDIRKNGAKGTTFNLLINGGAYKVDMKVAGLHNIYNAMAAAATAIACGISPESIRQGLTMFQAVGGRMEIIKLKNGAYLINDAYNANPASVREALLTLKDLKNAHNAFVFLGDMLELGEAAGEMHRRVGMLLATIGVTAVFLQGEFAEITAAGALGGGLSDEQIFFLKDVEESIAHLKRQLRKGDWILVKGSRRMKMDRIVARICEDTGIYKTEGKTAVE
ncbi:MAG: UDP-N-acetylmuramoyl-L-alanyl-D-glutamate--2,6-diaminopimelate ligase [Deltaproteobacteria bacterium HGW-Deltaproteobacteria-9]|nr:MAG: UDP-N-acetylmuramoyl-L-alanyl-D-glutamate--2,6-diaminopimelate ligase [Deltaproteobacteria bacterium HGW-Deltaproteobacteria-9]